MANLNFAKKIPWVIEKFDPLGRPKKRESHVFTNNCVKKLALWMNNEAKGKNKLWSNTLRCNDLIRQWLLSWSHKSNCLECAPSGCWCTVEQGQREKDDRTDHIGGVLLLLLLLKLRPMRWMVVIARENYRWHRFRHRTNFSLDLHSPHPHLPIPLPWSGFPVDSTTTTTMTTTTTKEFYAGKKAAYARDDYSRDGRGTLTWPHSISRITSAWQALGVVSSQSNQWG